MHSGCKQSEICRQILVLQKPIEVSWFNPDIRLECNCEQKNAKLLVQAKCTIHSSFCDLLMNKLRSVDRSWVRRNLQKDQECNSQQQACQLIGSSTNVPELKDNIYVLFQDLVVNTVRSFNRSWVCRNLQKDPQTGVGKMKSSNSVGESKAILLETEETKIQEKRSNGSNGENYTKILINLFIFNN